MRANLWYASGVKTRDARSLPPAAQEDLRRKAVNAVLAGRTRTEVAALFGVSRQALYNWLKAYRTQGARALKAHRRGRPKGGKLKGFEIAGPDEKYVPAAARIEGRTVVVSSPDVQSPKFVRYAWAGFPLCTLYNKEKLPAAPFRWPVPKGPATPKDK